MASNGIEVVSDWPPNSPDINPIEQVWGVVKRRFKNRRVLARNALWTNVRDALRHVDPGPFVAKMGENLRKVIDAGGGRI